MSLGKLSPWTPTMVAGGGGPRGRGVSVLSVMKKGDPARGPPWLLKPSPFPEGGAICSQDWSSVLEGPESKSAYPLHSGSRPAGPRHTYLPETGT